ncbi:MAG: DUF502 domain-containing protein [Chlamydiales bacterium]|nr:DUF502 domain-containing protein [Chlamydiales bacterium]
MKKYFLAGLAALLPIAVTLAVVIFIVHLLTNPFIGLVTQLFSHANIPSFGIVSSEKLIKMISQCTILAAIFLFTLLLGIVARWFFFHTVIKLSDKLLYRIPIINKVYKTTKEIIQTLFSSKENSFQQVVMISFPTKGCYCLGLITRNAPKTCQTATGTPMVTVFIPTTPNPTTGYLLICPISELIFLSMKPDEAIKYIVSCGAIQPEGPKEQPL